MGKKAAPARSAYYMGMRSEPTHYSQDTWLEPESLCYPHGGQTRRAKALYPDGRLRVVRCGLPDTFFSIPCRGGYLSIDDGVLRFHPRK